ncbi:claudin-8-like [Lampris incognitus]|uniref:claudin-8-like n=1 Tax=Lampris incognitus TaxID=2546036 RepID=UPI0024B4E40C|nr:claudin-8-like [Lampris incognitus]
MRAKLEILATVLGFLSLFGTITITVLPMWRVTAFIGAKLIVMETLWEGLWMNCYRQANIRMQCKVYDSLLILTPDLQAGRGLMCLSIALAFLALLVTGCGIRRTNCCRDSERGKNITLLIGGCLYLLCCVTTLIPVSWTGHAIIRDFYNPQLPDSQKRELGEALYVGWATAAILLITAVVLLYCFASRRSEDGLPHRGTYAMTEQDTLKGDAQAVGRQPSSFYKQTRYL